MATGATTWVATSGTAVAGATAIVGLGATTVGAATTTVATTCVTCWITVGTGWTIEMTVGTPGRRPCAANPPPNAGNTSSIVMAAREPMTRFISAAKRGICARQLNYRNSCGGPGKRQG